jgi:hypothetical protein
MRKVETLFGLFLRHQIRWSHQEKNVNKTKIKMSKKWIRKIEVQDEDDEHPRYDYYFTE